MICLIDINEIIQMSNGDKDVIPYLIKIYLKEHGFKVKINLKNIKNQKFESNLCYYKITDDYYIVFEE